MVGSDTIHQVPLPRFPKDVELQCLLKLANLQKKSTVFSTHAALESPAR